MTECAVILHGLDPATAEKIAREPVDFYSNERRKKIESLLPYTGSRIIEPLYTDNAGAPTKSYYRATNLNAAPIGGIGPFRIGEDGHQYFMAKSEHYHVPLGHNFTGYKLIDRARQLGVLNATHNNTRGYITRLMEREIVRCINGLDRKDKAGLDAIIASEEQKVLNRVINLETGSLAVEAGIKMMLARFYQFDSTYPAPKYSGKTPVFFVMADNNGGLEANYHGTTIITQTFRGLWPDYYSKLEQGNLYKVVSVRQNDIADFKEKLTRYNSGIYKTAGFLHEIILMNYGGIRLTKDYLLEAYRLCRNADTPTLVDEIQSCMWYKGMFLYRLYDLKPDFVILGKGFPGGEYPASKIVTTFEMDTLTQFGALVTNGQEELASLAYLVTMEFAEENADVIQSMGDYFEAGLVEIQKRHSGIIDQIEGKGHLAAIHFFTVEEGLSFSKKMNERYIDVSVQSYKLNCPPAALFKIPIILNKKMIDYLIGVIDDVLKGK